MARQKNWSYDSYDESEDISVVGNYIWDTGTLAWIKQTAAAGGGGGPVTIADGADVAEGSKSDAAWVSGDGTVISLLKKIASPGGGGLTDTELRATPVPVSGTVTATGPLTDTQLRASAVPVSGPLTDAQLRATPVPVSGTVTATGPLTDAQLRATPVPASISSIDGEGTIATAQVSVTTTAGTVVAARAGRRSLLIVNHGTTQVFLGPATVTIANGLLLPGVVGASISIPTTALVQGIVAAGAQTVSYIEVF